MSKSFRENLAGNTFILAFLLVASLGASPVVPHVVKDEDRRRLGSTPWGHGGCASILFLSFMPVI